jgi:cobalamin biosynthesis protein CbiD
MYLAKHIGGWSTTKIGRFYNGRHHTTVLHAIRKVERLRAADESVEALLEVLTAALSPATQERSAEGIESKWRSAIIEAVAARVLDRLAELSGTVGTNQK